MPSDAPTPKLFQPIQVGDITLQNRVALAPLTRARANKSHVHTDLAVKYYEQRASAPGTLLISEGTFIAAKAGGIGSVPGIWSEEQIVAWKKVTDAVHAKGSFIYCQLWALGRAARTAELVKEDPSFKVVSASAIPLTPYPQDIPVALSIPEIQEYVELYATAAANAVRAGFDGVEIHGANGYIVDQFLQDGSNKRTDEYGGSIENRARFALEVTEAIAARIGQKKTAIRLSPWSKFQDQGMADPVPQFTYLVEEYKKRVPDLAYLHIVGAGAFGNEGPDTEKTDSFIHKLWAPRATIICGGFERDTALKTAEETGQIIGFGQLFLANPDLVFRLQHNLKMNAPDPDSYYIPMSEKGYITYPFSDEYLKMQGKASL